MRIIECYSTLPLPALPVNLIPMSFNDPIFAGAVDMGGGIGVNMAIGDSLTLKSISNNPSYSSGDPAINMLGNNTLTKCRFDWREGPRISGHGFFTMDQCFINCTAKTGDHSDAVQAFSPFDSPGTWTLTNSCLRCYSTAEGAAVYGAGFSGSESTQWADNYQGTVNFSNVLIWGGDRGVNIFADTGTTTINFNNVFWVLSTGESVWPFSPYDIRATGGTLAVGAWNNCRNATIAGGVIVPGSLLPSP